MDTKERQRNERKPSIQVKVFADKGTWFSTPQYRPRAPTDTRQAVTKDADGLLQNNQNIWYTWRNIFWSASRWSQRSSHSSRFKWSLALYCCFSVLVLTARLLWTFTPGHPEGDRTISTRKPLVQSQFTLSCATFLYLQKFIKSSRQYNRFPRITS